MRVLSSPAVLAAAIGVALAAGCAAAPSAPIPPEPLWRSSARDCATEAVVGEADGLVATGLRAAGYSRLVVEPCSASARRGEVAAALAHRGLDLVTAMPERAVVAAGVDPARLRTVLSEAVIEARPWVLSGDPRVLSPDLIAIAGNREAIALARDPRAAPGGTVRADPDATVRSRAIGLKGLVVALTNRRTGPADVTVATAALGLSGTIRGVDAWTGRRFESRDGRLGGTVGAGDTVLVQIV